MASSLITARPVRTVRHSLFARPVRYFADTAASTFLGSLATSGQNLVKITHYGCRNSFALVRACDVVAVHHVSGIADRHGVGGSCNTRYVESILDHEAVVAPWLEVDVARDYESGNGLFYRAQFVRVTDDGRTRVRYVDFGNCGNIAANSLIVCPPELCAENPYAIPCKLAMRPDQVPITLSYFPLRDGWHQCFYSD
jgi:hypothetical protein